MLKACAVCGTEFNAKRKAARYCGERCKKRAQRRPGGTVVTLASAARPQRDAPAPLSGDGLAAATARALERAGRSDTELAAAAMLLARRLDSAVDSETGAGVAALMKEYRATLAEATKDAEAADDELDQIRGSAALKLLAGGA